MRTTKIITDSIKDQIYEILKDEIISGELTSGDQLVEQAIADRFHTSRSPVREAVKQLTGDGLVVNVTNKGTFVKIPTFDELNDMQEMRQILEVFAVNKVIHSLSEADKTELLNLRQRIINSRDTNNPEVYLELERTIWTSIIMMTGNSYVIDTYCKLYAITTNFSKSVITRMPRSTCKAAHGFYTRPWFICKRMAKERADSEQRPACPDGQAGLFLKVEGELIKGAGQRSDIFKAGFGHNNSV